MAACTSQPSSTARTCSRASRPWIPSPIRHSFRVSWPRCAPKSRPSATGSSQRRLRVAAYFRPLAARERDVVVLQAVSTGPRAGAYIEELQQSGDYSRMLYVNGLASGTAEALADYAHNLARRDLGLADNQGLRFSWGYPACPDLEEQRKVLPLLHAEETIGLTLSLSNNLD